MAKSAYILNRFYKMAVAWLDSKSLPPKISKVRKGKSWNIYINYQLIGNKRSLQAARRVIWNYFKEKSGL